ncbi:ski oncogene, partial [Plakobranchus ocellatus]
YERHYTPNVSLAPSSGQKSSGDCGEDDDEVESATINGDTREEETEEFRDPIKKRRRKQQQEEQQRRGSPPPASGGQTGQSGHSHDGQGDGVEEKARHRPRPGSPLTLPHKYQQHRQQHRQSSHDQQSPQARSRVDTREYDLPTDTDTESSSLASPTESCQDAVRLSTELAPLSQPSSVGSNSSITPESNLEREMTMIRQALQGKVDTSQDGQTRFLQEYARLRSKTEESLHWMVANNAALKRQYLELEELHAQKEKSLRKMAAENQNQKEQHKKLLCELEARLRELEALYRDACSENHVLRRELAFRAAAASSSSSSSHNHQHYLHPHHNHFGHGSSEKGINHNKGINGSSSAPAVGSIFTGKSRLRLALDGGGGPSGPLLSPRSGNGSSAEQSLASASAAASGIQESGKLSEVKREREITVD